MFSISGDSDFDFLIISPIFSPLLFSIKSSLSVDGDKLSANFSS